MSFFNIVPRDKEYLGYTINSIPLTVIQDDEIEVKPNINIKTNELNDGYVQFYDSGSRGEVFNISIIMHKNDTIDGVKGETNITPYWKYNKENTKPFTAVSVKQAHTGKVKLIDLLDYIIRGMIPVMIVTDAIDIPNNQLYYITENDSRKQSHREYTKWELTFQTYDPLKLIKYKNNNSNVLNAIKRAKAAHKKATPKKAKSAQCSGGVYQYFESFLPDADPVAWQKFNQIRDTGSGAKYYYYKNKDLGKNGFAMDKDINKITPGTIIVYKGSSSSSVGHVQVVEANDGRGNLTIFECNTDRYKSAGCTRSSSGGKCCTHTESTSFYSNMINGKMKDYEFLAFIHILSDCSKNTTNSVNNNKTNTSIN